MMRQYFYRSNCFTALIARSSFASRHDQSVSLEVLAEKELRGFYLELESRFCGYGSPLHQLRWYFWDSQRGKSLSRNLAPTAFFAYSLDLVYVDRNRGKDSINHLDYQPFLFSVIRSKTRETFCACNSFSRTVAMFLYHFLTCSTISETFYFTFLLFTTVLSQWDFSHGKFGLISPVKSSCD